MVEEFKKINAAIIVSFWWNLVVPLTACGVLILANEFLPVNFAPVITSVFIIGFFIYLSYKQKNPALHV